MAINFFNLKSDKENGLTSRDREILSNVVHAMGMSTSVLITKENASSVIRYIMKHYSDYSETLLKKIAEEGGIKLPPRSPRNQ